MNNRESDPNGNPIHQPQYVILEAEEGFEKKGEQQSESFENLRRVSSIHYPWTIHFAIFGGLILVLFFSLFLIAYFAVTLVLAAVTLFQSNELNQSFFKAWKIIKMLAVVLTGLTIAIFSPAFGFGTIMLYSLLHGDVARGSTINRFFSGRFTR